MVDSAKSWVPFCIFCVTRAPKDVVWWSSGLVKFLESNLIAKLKRDEENTLYHPCFGGKYRSRNIIFYFTRRDWNARMSIPNISCMCYHLSSLLGSRVFLLLYIWKPSEIPGKPSCYLTKSPSKTPAIDIKFTEFYAFIQSLRLLQCNCKQQILWIRKQFFSHAKEAR